MKVCIPTEGEGGIDDTVGQHFGRVPTYTLVDIDTNEVEVIPNTSEHRGGVGVPPDFISKTGTHVMLCSGLGPKAVHLFEEVGIDVFVGAGVYDCAMRSRRGSRGGLWKRPMRTRVGSTGVTETWFGMS